MNVFDYFAAQLGCAPENETLRDLAVETACGLDCRKVIDAARAYLAAADSHPDVREPLIDSVNAAVNVLWIG
jgi:hypothetical protein